MCYVDRDCFILPPPSRPFSLALSLSLSLSPSIVPSPSLSQSVSLLALLSMGATRHEGP